jgi:UDP-glucose 4-epimerase
MIEQNYRVFVVGGAGFIGSHLVNLLLQCDAIVGVIDDLSFGHRSFVPVESDAFHFFRADVLDLEKLRSMFREFRPQIVYHLAAIHHIPTCENNPERALRVNVEGTQCVLTAAREADSVEKIIFASTGAIYANVNEPLNESTEIMPQNIYGVTKVAGEHLLQLYAQRTATSCIAARLFNAVGPRETNAHLVPDILGQVKTGKRDIVLGNITPVRCYTHVMDMAAGLLALADTPEIRGYDVFNVASTENYSVADIIVMLSDVLGETLTPVQAADRVRKVDRLTQQADVSKIAARTGWRATRTVRNALAEALAETLSA